MKGLPVLAKLPAKRRTILFPAFVVGLFLLVFLVLALAVPEIFYAIVLAPVAAVVGAWVLVGWPELRPAGAPPLVGERAKPFLFFPLALVLGLVLYPLVGYPLTRSPLPVSLVSYVDLAIVVPVACGVAYWLVGFPHVVRAVKEQYARVPPERRPYLFFPIFVVLFLVLFVGIGAASTAYVGGSGAYVNYEVLLVLPLAALVAGGAAYLLVGFPKLTRNPAAVMQKVTGRTRPRAFLITLILLGIPLTYGIGALLSAFAEFLPVTVVFPLAVVLGYAASLGVSVLVWGTPRAWARKYDDYKPGLAPRARVPIFLGTGLAVGLAVLLAFGAAGLDFFWGFVAGLVAGALVTLTLFGVPRRIAARRGQTLVPDLPDRLKPLILFPAWLIASALLFAVLTYSLPGLVAANLLASIFVSLVVVLLLLEQPLMRDIVAERRAERAKRKAFEARRKARLDEADKGAPGSE